MLKEFLFTERKSLFSTLAKDCEAHLADALHENNQASFMVSGGSTPTPLYETLSRSALNWKNIHVALIDERWVDTNHSASNEALIYRTLIINQAKCAPFTGMKTPAVSPSAGLETCEAHYRNLPQPFTVSILGMGNDAHTASLFPHAEGLSTALSPNNPNLTAAITAKQSDVTGPNTERISMTLNGLLKSKRLIVLLTGAEKLTVFRTAMNEGAVEDMPIRALIRQNKVPLELYWAP